MDKTRILIIDDSSTIRDTLRLTLEFRGYEVEEAGNGAEGLDLIQCKDFALVFCDLAMPVMDGLTLIREVRETLQNVDLPIIVLSAEDVAAKHKAIQTGANTFVQKPFSPQQILRTVEQALDGRA